jgi:predicted nucleic acid-binding protein
MDRALPVACALASKADSFVTNDKRLHKIAEIDILPLLSKDSV